MAQVRHASFEKAVSTAKAEAGVADDEIGIYPDLPEMGGKNVAKVLVVNISSGMWTRWLCLVDGGTGTWQET